MRKLTRRGRVFDTVLREMNESALKKYEVTEHCEEKQGSYLANSGTASPRNLVRYILGVNTA